MGYERWEWDEWMVECWVGNIKPETLVLMHKSRFFSFSTLLPCFSPSRLTHSRRDSIHLNLGLYMEFTFQLICLFSQIENEKSYRSNYTMLIMKSSFFRSHSVLYFAKREGELDATTRRVEEWNEKIQTSNIAKRRASNERKTFLGASSWYREN